LKYTADRCQSVSQVTQQMNKKRGPYKSRIPPPKTTPKPHDRISKGEAISWITGEILQYSAERREIRDKVGQRVRYAIEKGRLSLADGQIVFGELIAWARESGAWKEELAKFPGIFQYDCIDHGRISDRAYDVTLPPTLEKSHKTIQDLHERIEEKERELSECKREMEHLQPKAKR